MMKSCFRKWFVLGAAMSALVGLAGCSSGALDQPISVGAIAQSDRVDAEQGAPSSIHWLPMPGGAIHGMADDLNGDGRKELVFVNHSGNFARVLVRDGLEGWRGLPHIGDVGFHPKDMIALPGHEGRYYLSNSEGASRLRVFAPDASAQLSLVADVEAHNPRSSSAFVWPGWGLSLASLSYEGNEVTLRGGFDPQSGLSEFEHVVRGMTQRRLGEHVLVADLDSDGMDELYVTAFEDRAVWRLSFPDSRAEPVPERVAELPGRGYLATRLVVVDVNGDESLDLLVPSSTEPVVYVMLNDGEGGFDEVAYELVLPGAVTGVSAIAAVPTGDGALVAVGSFERLVLFRLASDGGLEARVLRLPGNGVRYMFFDQVLGNAEPDLFVTTVLGERSVFMIPGPVWDNSRFLPDETTDWQ